jgi:dTDP-glucose pyrophosphorylase
MALKNIEHIQLKVSDTIEKAIEVIHLGGIRIAVVVDSEGKLLGTVTDGDIRRTLVNHMAMDGTVDKIMNEHPLTATLDENKSIILSRMNGQDLLHMPIIDDNGVLVDLETIQDLTQQETYDNPVFLMAGGFGKRLYPLTNDAPKPLLRVGGKPILETILNQFYNAGFKKFFFSIHYKAEMIRDYFGDGSKWNVEINYIYEDKPLGTAGSLGLLPKNLPNKPIIMMNGDLLTKVNFKYLLDFHIKNKGVATICVREYDFQVPYGVVESDGMRINSIIEKPIHKFFINAGIYVLEPSLVKNIKTVGNIDMTHFIANIINDNKIINMFPLYENWIDIGQMEEFERANNDENIFI